MREPSYLQKINGIWRVRVPVPPSLSEHLPPPHTGKKNLTETTYCRDKRLAAKSGGKTIIKFLDLIAVAARKNYAVEREKYEREIAKFIDWEAINARLVLKVREARDARRQATRRGIRRVVDSTGR
jgi:hypothetical protein